MFKLRYTNARGDSTELFGRPFRLVSVQGLGDVEADNQMQKSPYQDGATRIDTTLETRNLSIELKITGSNYNELTANRRKLASIFNPKLGEGKLEYIGNDHKIISAAAESVPFFPDGSSNRSRSFQKAQIDLVCPNPYWQSESVTGEPAFEPRFHFPFKNKPFIMGIQRDRRIIDNDGDAPTPLQVEFFGPAENPKIINRTTGEYIKVNQTLEEDEKMMIDTTDGIKSVFFVDEEENERDVFNWIDLGSTFFDLVVGENDIEYTADSDIQGATVDITYKKYYVGV